MGVLSTVKPVLNGNLPQRKPVFWEKFYSPEDPILSSCLKRNLPVATENFFAPVRFRCGQVSLCNCWNDVRLSLNTTGDLDWIKAYRLGSKGGFWVS